MRAGSLVEVLLGFVVQLLVEIVADVHAVVVSFVEVAIEVGPGVLVHVLVEVGCQVLVEVVIELGYAVWAGV